MTAPTSEDTGTTHEPPAARARPGLRCLLAAAGGAAATGLATPPLALAWLQWPALALVVWALRGRSVRQAALVGACLGLGINVSLFTWLGVAAARLGELSPVVATAAFVAWAAFASAQFALVGALAASAAGRWPGARRALLPCAFVAGEALWPKVIPWTLGLPQLACLPLAQVAELGGAPLLTLVVVCGAAGVEAALTLLHDALRRRPVSRRDAVDAAWAAAVLAASLGFGLTRLHSPPASPPGSLRVAIVQPNVVDNSMTPRAPDEVQAALVRLARQVGAAGGVALAVFPEAAAARPLIDLQAPPGGATDGRAPGAEATIRADAARGRADLSRIARLCGAPTLIGVRALRVVAGETLETSRIVERRNAVVLLDARGVLVDRYDKHALLAFAEDLPGEGALPWLRALAPFAGHYTPGPGPRRLDAGALTIAPLICFEAVPGWPAREALALGHVDLLVNSTNDVWFPGQGPHLHALAASLRAIETRRPLVRATTTGLSFAVLPDGRRVGQAPPEAPSVQIVDLPRAEGRTAHSSGGHLLGWLVTALSLIAATASCLTRWPNAQQADQKSP